LTCGATKGLDISHLLGYNGCSRQAFAKSLKNNDFYDIMGDIRE
jgi:hypothetical protein